MEACKHLHHLVRRLYVFSVDEQKHPVLGLGGVDSLPPKDLDATGALSRLSPSKLSPHRPPPAQELAS
jgi:hypothetical protein